MSSRSHLDDVLFGPVFRERVTEAVLDAFRQLGVSESSLKSMTEQHDPEELLTPAEARAIKRVGNARLFRALQDGSLPAKRVGPSKGCAGSRWLIRRADVISWQP